MITFSKVLKLWAEHVGDSTIKNYDLTNGVWTCSDGKKEYQFSNGILPNGAPYDKIKEIHKNKNINT